MVSYNFCPTLRDSSRIILLPKVCGDGQEGSYECYRQDWYFYASLVAGNLKISEIYNANKLYSRTRQLFNLRHAGSVAQVCNLGLPPVEGLKWSKMKK